MKRNQLLDYGRFFAAFCVLMFHYLFNGINNGKITSISEIPEVVEIVKYGYLGVDFFFIISGYVIFFSSKNRSAREFVVSRAVRLCPAFWVAVIFTSCFAMFWGGNDMSVSYLRFIANFSMATIVYGGKFVDGVYWTLTYELHFYALILLFLVIGAKNKVEKVFLLWPFLIWSSVFFNLSYLPYLSGSYCYFSIGGLFAIIKEKKTILTVVSLLVNMILCVFIAVSNAEQLALSKGIFYSEFIVGVIVICFFVFFAVCNSKIGSELNLYGSKILGGITYPVYLIHAHFGYMFLSQFATEENKVIIYFIVVIIVLLIATFIHVLIELKYSEFWKKNLDYIVGRPVENFNKLAVKLIDK